MSYLSSYQKASKKSWDLSSTILYLLSLCEGKMQEAQKAYEINDLATSAQCSADAAFNLSLLLGALKTDTFEETPALASIRKTIALVIELIYRSQTQENPKLFQEIEKQLGTLKNIFSEAGIE